jgi:hypothetical protein
VLEEEPGDELAAVAYVELLEDRLQVVLDRRSFLSKCIVTSMTRPAPPM